MLRRLRLFLPLLTLLVFALLLSLAPASSATSAGPSKSWKLLFVRSGDIWIANGDGTNQHRLIVNGDAPCWSPNKKLVAFERGGNIWVADSNGSHLRQLTFRWKSDGPPPNGADRYTDGRDFDISWDPVDNLITFSRWEAFYLRREGDKTGKTIYGCSIYDVPLHPTSDLRAEVFFDIFDDEAMFHPSDNGHPAWSRSGKYMAYVRNGDIWIATRAVEQDDPNWSWPHKTWTAWGWENTRVAAAAQYDAPTYRGSRENYFPGHISWSPDSNRLAYDIGRINGTDWLETRILPVRDKDDVISLGGKEIDIDDAADPTFSPDGKFIAYFDRSSGAVVAMSLATRKVTPLVAKGYEPTW